MANVLNINHAHDAVSLQPEKPSGLNAERSAVAEISRWIGQKPPKTFAATVIISEIGWKSMDNTPYKMATELPLCLSKAIMLVMAGGGDLE